MTTMHPFVDFVYPRQANTTTDVDGNGQADFTVPPTDPGSIGVDYEVLPRPSPLPTAQPTASDSTN